MVKMISSFLYSKFFIKTLSVTFIISSFFIERFRMNHGGDNPGDDTSRKMTLVVADFEKKHAEISLRVKELVGENESLQKRLIQAQNQPVLTNRNTENSDFMATQLMETEHVLSQERQQAVRAMNQASNLQRQNEQLKKYIQQSQG